MDIQANLALEPALVVLDRFAPGYVGPVGEAELDTILERGMPHLPHNGGDPRRASGDKGAIYIERLADFLVEQVGRLPTPPR